MKFCNILIFIILTAGIFGCSDQDLELSPISSLNSQDFYKSKSDFENAIYGAYASLRLEGTYHDGFQLIGELRSDNAEMGSTANVRFFYLDIQEFRDQSTNPVTEVIWDDHYFLISVCNSILDRIDGLDADQAFKDRITGEAKFLRGLSYFNLVRVFGGVPLTTHELTIEEGYDLTREDIDAVYSQIIADLSDAASVLPLQVGGEEGRATKGAASALLGKVFLTTHDFANARDRLAEVISSNQYELLADYGDLWIYTNKNHKESIYDVQFQESTSFATGSIFQNRYFPYLYEGFGFYSTEGGYMTPTLDMVGAYETNDLRKDLSLRETWIGATGVKTGIDGRHPIKYSGPTSQTGGGEDNWPVLRYADVLLMYAEALNEISFPDADAFKYLNEIRTRAGLPPKTMGNAIPALSVDSQQDFRLAIEQERRVELAFEGHRWFDLVRTGRAIEVLGPKVTAGVQAFRLIFPIPQKQINNNPAKISQNQGY